MSDNAALKIEHDSQAIYYPCILNLGYRIVCITTSFWSCRRCTLDACIFHWVQIGIVKKWINENNGGGGGMMKMMYVSASTK